MPYIHVRITRDGVTKSQKAQIVREMTDTLVRVLGKKPEHRHIVIEEVDTDNWGFAGELTSTLRAKAAGKSTTQPAGKRRGQITK